MYPVLLLLVSDLHSYKNISLFHCMRQVLYVNRIQTGVFLAGIDEASDSTWMISGFSKMTIKAGRITIHSQAIFKPSPDLAIFLILTH